MIFCSLIQESTFPVAKHLKKKSIIKVFKCALNLEPNQRIFFSKCVMSELQHFHHRNTQRNTKNSYKSQILDFDFSKLTL